uniref:Uncharacterized protein n=1 Tax=Rhizophora mucronata TaxID=61149 RepID=A0A2P2IIN0_RHIMU
MMILVGYTNRLDSDNT